MSVVRMLHFSKDWWKGNSYPPILYYGYISIPMKSIYSYEINRPTSMMWPMLKQTIILSSLSESDQLWIFYSSKKIPDSRQDVLLQDKLYTM